MQLADLETTFETLVDSFVFLDKNKDGFVSKTEMVHAINETAAGERSSGRIAMKRFGQSFSSHFHLIVVVMHMKKGKKTKIKAEEKTDKAY